MSLPRLHLDYVARPPRKGVLGVAVLILSLVSFLVIVERWSDLNSELAAREAAQGLVARERPAAPRKGADEEMKAAEAVVRQLALPWAEMVRAVEDAASPEVALLQMQPEARERLLRLSAEAKNEQAMLGYLERLAATRSLAEVHLASHQVVTDDPRRPIQFTVLARLKGTP